MGWLHVGMSWPHGGLPPLPHLLAEDQALAWTLSHDCWKVGAALLRASQGAPAS